MTRAQTVAALAPEMDMLPSESGKTLTIDLDNFNNTIWPSGGRL